MSEAPERIWLSTDDIPTLCDEVERLEARVKELRKALEWYADDAANVHPRTGAHMTPYVDGKPHPTLPFEDRGHIARAALAKDGDKT